MRRIEYDPFGGCWLWSGAQISNAGYGNIPIRGKATAASRVAWMVFRGPIPKGLVVCHKCDVRLCCNPDHLFVGTQRDNVIDMIRKGRANPPRGSQTAISKLNESKVAVIRKLLRDGETQRSVASCYDVSDATIQAIAEWRTWRHVVIDQEAEST